MTSARKFIPLVLMAYLLPLSAWSVWTGLASEAALKRQLLWLSPWTLELTFALLAVALVLNWSLLRAAFEEAPRPLRLAAVGLALSAVGLAAFVSAPTHRVYYDEDIYENIGQGIAGLERAGMCSDGQIVDGEYRCLQFEYNKEPNGWPFLLALAFRAFGTRESVAFALNNALIGLTTLAVFLIGSILFAQPWAGIYAAALYALTPMNLVWFATVAAEPSASFSAALAVLAVLLYAREPGARTLLLAAAALPWAAQGRAESILIFCAAVLAVALWRPHAWKEPQAHAFAALALLLLTPHLLHLHAVRGEDWGSPGAKFAWANFAANLRTNGLFYLRNLRFPALFTVLAVLGLAPGEGRGRARLLLGAWFLLFFGVFLSFYAGSYEYGTDVRFSLVSCAPLALLGGWGAWRASSALGLWFGQAPQARAAVLAAIVLHASSFLPLARTVGEESWAARSDHFFAEKMAAALPEDSVVLTHDPSLFLLRGRSAAQLFLAANPPAMEGFFRRYAGGVYFHYNFWCESGMPGQESYCRQILKDYKTAEVQAFEERGRHYRLYRLLSARAERPALAAGAK